MSVRWMAVQYVGNTLRLPIVNEGNMDRPFGSSVLERDVRRIVVNPFSDSPQVFVPEAENAKLRELVRDLYFDLLGEMPESMLEDRRSQMLELRIEVDE